MRILFLHQNMPGQYKHIARKLAENKRNEVKFITKRTDRDIPGVERLSYKPRREPSKDIHRYLGLTENALLHGQQVARVLIELKRRGFRPDVICAHPGWGEALFAKDVFPNSPLLSFFEFYYHAKGADVGFNPEEKIELDDECRIRTKNITNILSLEAADAGMSPTFWQYQQHPPEYRYKISVIHDGVDTKTLVPNPEAKLQLPSGRVLTREDEVITYCVRNLEPYRGFPWFMRAVEKLCKERPNGHFVLLGGDGTSYGKKAPDGKTYREIALEEVDIDPDRVHFLGQVPYGAFRTMLQVSSVHVYLTYPFVLSWSMLEAMAAECLVVGSSTAPVLEVIEHGQNGLLCDFFNPDDIAEKVCHALENPDEMAPLRKAARETVLERYDLEKCIARQMTLIKNLHLGHRPVMGVAPGKPGEPEFAPAKRLEKKAS